MKKVLLTAVLLMGAAVLCAQGQAQPYLWPIQGAKPGDNIISAPQSYIDGDLNFGALIIGAPEGTTVLSPTDGTITHLSLSYMPSLTSSISWRYNLHFDQGLKNASQYEIPGAPKFLSGMLSIRSKDGKTIYISGLSGDQTWKTGQTVRRGQPIGRVAYFYHKIDEPCICVSISSGGTSSDPMSPFGIPSTYRPPAERKPILSLTQQQAKEDFLLYIDILKEAFPGLYDVLTPEELEAYIAQTVATIEAAAGDLEYTDFQEIILGAIAKIHDSHIYFLGSPLKKAEQPALRTAIDFGWINDTLICTNAIPEYRELLRKRIKSVNGMSADSIRKRVLAKVAVYDAKVESYIDYHLAFANRYCGFGAELEVEFAEKIRVATGLDTLSGVTYAEQERFHLPGVAPETLFCYDFNRFERINYHKEGYATARLSPTTIYLGFSHFNQTQVQVEKIGAFIRSIADIPHLVIDLRNNGGGGGDVVDKLYSYIVRDTLRLNRYTKVNKRGYEAFRHSLNWSPDAEAFPQYLQEEGKAGFYLRPPASVITADSATHYKGKIYMLTNQRSASAGSLFPTMLVRNRRGVTVGRETRTAFHFMNASKFMDITLPHSRIAVKIPLIHLVSDTLVSERTPWGRGVLPDYPVPLTMDEISGQKGDVLLAYTLELIERGAYFPDEAPAGESGASRSIDWIALIVAGSGYAMYRRWRNIARRK